MLGGDCTECWVYERLGRSFKLYCRFVLIMRQARKHISHQVKERVTTWQDLRAHIVENLESNERTKKLLPRLARSSSQSEPGIGIMIAYIKRYLEEGDRTIFDRSGVIRNATSISSLATLLPGQWLSSDIIRAEGEAWGE